MLTSCAATVVLVMGVRTPQRSPVELVHAPESGTERHLCFELERELACERASMTVVGLAGPRSVEDLPGRRRLVRRDRRSFAWTDVHGERGEGTFLVARTYGRLEATSRDDLLDEAERTLGGRGVLEGDLVLFERDQETGRSSRRFGASTPTDGMHLEGLEDPSALAALLPEGPVSIGASWCIDGSTFGSVYAYGGRIEAPSPDGFDVVSPIDRALASAFEGELRAELTETTTVAGEEVAVLRLSGVLSAEGSSRRVRPLPAHSPYFEPEEDAGRWVRMELEVEGTLRWSLSRRDLCSLNVACRVEWEEEADHVLPFPGTWAFADHVGSCWTGALAIRIDSDDR